MKLRQESLEFLKISQRLSGATLLITDKENTIIELTPDEQISYEKKKISEEMKNLEGDRKKNREEMISVFENDTFDYSAQVIRRLFKNGEPVGFIIYYSDKGGFSDGIEEFADTAKYFVERMLQENQLID